MEGTYLGLEYMSDKKGGRGGAIINVASFGGRPLQFIVVPNHHQKTFLGIVPMLFSPAYCASKFGVVGFSRSLTQAAITDSVRVNCICPEFVNTRLVTEELPDASDETKGLIASKGLLQ